jgi:UDP-2-acetamido-3-amino-2,3-dideoxy-glucuronate N-acetyltransferase
MIELVNKKAMEEVGDNVLIGANVTLMPNFSIGNDCVIGACSQIRCDIPDGEVWYGNPAKFLKLNK